MKYNVRFITGNIVWEKRGEEDRHENQLRIKIRKVVVRGEQK